jgi:hypothetical protein
MILIKLKLNNEVEELFSAFLISHNYSEAQVKYSEFFSNKFFQSRSRRRENQFTHTLILS